MQIQIHQTIRVFLIIFDITCILILISISNQLLITITIF